MSIKTAVGLWRRHPVAAFCEVLMLGCGLAVGASAIVAYGALSGLSSPVVSPERVLTITARQGLSTAEYESLRRSNEVFDDIGAFETGQSTAVQLPGSVAPVRVLYVTGGVFRVLGVAPFIGRLFDVEEIAAGRLDVVVISHSAWRRLFRGDTAIVGQQLSFSQDGQTVFRATLIGVLPPGFQVQRSPDADALFPLTEGTPPQSLASRLRTDGRQIIGRLRADIGPDFATSKLSSVHANFLEDRGLSAARFPLRVESLQQHLFGPLRPLATMLLATGLMVLAGSVVAAGLLFLSVVAARERDILIERALGASHWTIVRRTWIQGALIGTPSGVLAVGLLRQLLSYAHALNPSDSRYLDSVQLDVNQSVWVICGGIALGALFATLGLALPSQRASLTLLSSLARDYRPALRRRLLLVSLQIMVAVGFAVPSSLLTKTLSILTNRPLGFMIEDVAHAQITSTGGYPSGPAWVQLANLMRARALATPGVSAAAVSSTAPLEERFPRVVVFPGDGSRRGVGSTSVTPGYFEALGIPLLAGRDFHVDDLAETAIVNESYAKDYFGNVRSALGKHVDFGRQPQYRIVGVVGDARESFLMAALGPVVYRPFHHQKENDILHVVAKTTKSGGPDLLLGSLGVVDPRLPVTIGPLSERFRDQTARVRSLTYLVFGVAGVALTVAAIACFSACAYAVQTRRSEIAVRVALGATPSIVARAFVRDTLPTLTLGLALGGLVAYLCTGLVSHFLFEVERLDPMAWTVSISLVLLALVSAIVVPAARGAMHDPASMLRGQ